ncbi:hypothetical protein MmiAt1_02960 [Methanimicrococcus sp. At1]|uniref:Uncharacterized protein n=1 Tax=Methanimicrococcus hacksteinii TaxID=3028293 RepID=A0ABU3VN61_9EURY|nr:hypothetical protein [Methanimicrococcus sp. At1]
MVLKKFNCMNTFDKTNIGIYPNVIAEKRELLQEYTTFRIPYTDRKDLSSAEKVCIGNYQDVHFWNKQKKDWNFNLPKNWEIKPWCYAINSCCRDTTF